MTDDERRAESGHGEGENKTQKKAAGTGGFES